MDHTKRKSKQERLLTRDEGARIAASTVNAVLEKGGIRQIVEGIAVFPKGQGVLLVDVVIRDLTLDTTWAISITIPPAQEETDEGD